MSKCLHCGAEDGLHRIMCPNAPWIHNEPHRTPPFSDVLAERERCAKIVDMAYREFDGWGKDPKVDACRSVLSAIIRSGDSWQNWADAPNSVDPLTAAERARCAKIAEQIKKAAFRFMSDDDIGFNEVCDEIAAKIRSGE